MAIGGTSLKVQEIEMRARPDIVVATPGRLVDHIQNTHSFDLETVEVSGASCLAGLLVRVLFTSLKIR